MVFCCLFGCNRCNTFAFDLKNNSYFITFNFTAHCVRSDAATMCVVHNNIATRFQLLSIQFKKQKWKSIMMLTSEFICMVVNPIQKTKMKMNHDNGSECNERQRMKLLTHKRSFFMLRRRKQSIKQSTKHRTGLSPPYMCKSIIYIYGSSKSKI